MKFLVSITAVSVVLCASFCAGHDESGSLPPDFKTLCLEEYQAKANWDKNRNNDSMWADYLQRMERRIAKGQKLRIYNCPQELIKGIIRIPIEGEILPFVKDAPVPIQREETDKLNPQVAEIIPNKNSEVENFHKLCRKEYRAKARYDVNPRPKMWEDYQQKMEQRIAEGHRLKIYYCPREIIRGIIQLDFELGEISEASLPPTKPEGSVPKEPSAASKLQNFEKKKRTSFLNKFFRNSRK